MRVMTTTDENLFKSTTLGSPMTRTVPNSLCELFEGNYESFLYVVKAGACFHSAKY